MLNEVFEVREAKQEEFAKIGQLMVRVYSDLDGFPSETEQPDYYKMLRNVDIFTNNPSTKLLVAVSEEGTIYGAVVYFGDMQYYGSGGTATQEKNAGGFRLLAVSPEAQGNGIGKLLTLECIKQAKDSNLNQVIIHTTKSMEVAWKMYENIGFKRSTDLDFMQAELPVFGFRLFF